MDEKIVQTAAGLLIPVSGYEKGRLAEISKGHAVVSIEITESSLNTAGHVHGGFLYTLCDMSSGMVSISEGRHSVTLNGSINYIKGISQGTLRIDAHSIHTGRKTIVVDTKVTNEENDLIASGTFTMYKVGDL